MRKSTMSKNAMCVNTPRKRLFALMEQAALLERDACFEDAAYYWLASLALAEKWSERHWCEARASLCQKRVMT
ncbi:hypothetical protein BSQ98_24690 [Serratia liquefaciens]|uniref:ANR family transcriptional regulator n=1 Tax=Serratia TaxID=613 RepID=UPI00101F4DC0|nr:ANR family transcriptional regulator [Serratia liquefaciens]RYM58204.1 hypothetical protein BSQ98_24690 [Serratia liquefaciens]